MRHRLPPLNTLKAFEAAARHESFTRAAQELCVTQGAVSQQVKALEGELGLKLFNRERQGLVVTIAGREYLARLRLRPTRRVYCYHIAEDSVRLAMLVNDGQMQARLVVLAQKLPTWASPLQGNNRLSRVLQSN